MGYIIDNNRNGLLEKIANKYDKTKGETMIDYIKLGFAYMSNKHGYKDYNQSLNNNDHFEVVKLLIGSYKNEDLERATMIHSHIKKLYDIATKCEVDLSAIVQTYSLKQSQYLYRDLKIGKATSIVARQQGERAINVIEQYAIKKLGYEK